MLRGGYNVQFEGTVVRSTPEPTLLTRENDVQRDQGWSWIVLFAAFLTLFITNGMHASFGILYAALISHFNSGREETAWIGSISLGLLCFFSPVASVLIEQIGCRATSIIGAFLCSLGFLITSFATGIALLYFSHGLLFGLGTSLTYTAAMTVVSRSFERRRNIATGLCTSGSQFGGISLAPLSQVLFDRLGYANTFRTFAGLLLVVAISSLAYRSELSGNSSRSSSTKKSPREMLSVWKSKAYIVWVLATTLVILGYNIPRYTLAKYASDQGISKDASAWLVSYLCASSAIGRITFGRLCEWIPNLYLCQVCIVGCAVSTLLYPFLKSYLGLVITAIVFGLPDGGFVASLSVITTEIVGPEKMVEGFGFMLFCQSYSNVLGPPLSGMLYDTYKSYKAAFCFAAVPEFIGAFMLFLIPYYRRNQVRYTEYYSNSGILGNGNGAASTLNPISETPILPADEPRGEYNVVINLTSDNPDVRLVNLLIHKAGGSETTGVTCNVDETDKSNIAQIQDNGIVNEAVEETEVPVCSGEMPVCSGEMPVCALPLATLETISVAEQPIHETPVQSVVIGNGTEPSILPGLSPLKTCNNHRLKHESAVEATYADSSTQTVNEILPVAVLTAQTSATTLPRENESQVLNVELAAPLQTLVAIVSNESDAGSRQGYETPGIVNFGLRIKTSNESLSLEATASVVRITSDTMPSADGLDNLTEEIIHLQTEQDVPKISPPPQHKHHAKTDLQHVPNADISTVGCHDKVVDSSPEAMLAELDSLVQGNEMPANPCQITSFHPDVNNQQASLIKCTGLESGIIAGFTPEPGLDQNHESLMLSTNLIAEMTSPCLSTAFPVQPSHMSGMSDILTQKQLPEPLKPTSFSSVRGNNEQHSAQTPDLPPATSPLSCELSTVIADVIQSLTSQQSASQKSTTKESTISSTMADNCQGYSVDPLDKKIANIVENAATKEPKLGINVEPSSQASIELSSYCKLQTSVLHSMQNIVAEGCPEDVALLEDISIDLTLDKDPSFASIVLIDDANEEKNTADLHAISGQTQADLARQPSAVSHEVVSTAQSNKNQVKNDSISCQEQNIEPHLSLTCEQAIAPSFVSNQRPSEPDASAVNEKHFTALTQELSVGISSLPPALDPPYELTKKNSSIISIQEVQFSNVVHEPVGGHSIVSTTEKQPFTVLESTIAYSNPCSVENEQNASLLQEELTITNPSCTTDVIYEDGVVLELFPIQSTAETASIYEGVKSHEKLTAPIESSNPFYQEISK